MFFHVPDFQIVVYKQYKIYIQYIKRTICQEFLFLFDISKAFPNFIPWAGNTEKYPTAYEPIKLHDFHIWAARCHSHIINCFIGGACETMIVHLPLTTTTRVRFHGDILTWFPSHCWTSNHYRDRFHHQQQSFSRLQEPRRPTTNSYYITFIHFVIFPKHGRCTKWQSRHT